MYNTSTVLSRAPLRVADDVVVKKKKRNNLLSGNLLVVVFCSPINICLNKVALSLADKLCMNKIVHCV